MQWHLVYSNGFSDSDNPLYGLAIKNRATMSIQADEKTKLSSNKSKQVQHNKNTSLYYFNPNTRRAITLFGESKILTDKETKSLFWFDELKNFGYSSIDDESYCIIEFAPKIYKFF